MGNSNIIEQYYQGISQQLHAEVHFINTLFRHQGMKGDRERNDIAGTPYSIYSKAVWSWDRCCN